MKNFSYDHYLKIVDHLSSERKIVTFSEAKTVKKFLILRHDLDYSLDAALTLAKLEEQNGIRSTYLIMANSDYYSTYSTDLQAKIRGLSDIAAEVGVHFDLSGCSSVSEADDFFGLQRRELELIIKHNVSVASAHEPLKRNVQGFELPKDIIDCYSPRFTKEAMYISDSCQFFRKGNPLELETNEPVQLLTHPIWWTLEGREWSRIIPGFFEARKEAADRQREWLLKFYGNYHKKHAVKKCLGGTDAK